MALIKQISEIKLKDIGEDILLARSKNHHNDTPGIKFIIPLLINILRLNERS